MQRRSNLYQVLFKTKIQKRLTGGEWAPSECELSKTAPQLSGGSQVTEGLISNLNNRWGDWKARREIGYLVYLYDYPTPAPRIKSTLTWQLQSTDFTRLNCGPGEDLIQRRGIPVASSTPSLDRCHLTSWTKEQFPCQSPPGSRVTSSSSPLTFLFLLLHLLFSTSGSLISPPLTAFLSLGSVHWYLMT